MKFRLPNTITKPQILKTKKNKKPQNLRILKTKNHNPQIVSFIHNLPHTFLMFLRSKAKRSRWMAFRYQHKVIIFLILWLINHHDLNYYILILHNYLDWDYFIEFADQLNQQKAYTISPPVENAQSILLKDICFNAKNVL